MKSQILLTLGALVIAGIALVLILPRGNNQAGPLPSQVELGGMTDLEPNTGEQPELEPVVRDQVQGFLDATLAAAQAAEDSQQRREIDKALSYLTPELRRSFGPQPSLINLLELLEVNQAPENGYKILSTEIINSQRREAIVALQFADEPLATNIELSERDNQWLIDTVHTVE